MTIEQIYNWAKKNNAEGLEVVVQYRDEYGYDCGADEELKMEVGYYSFHYDYVNCSEAYADKEGYKKVVIL